MNNFVLYEIMPKTYYYNCMDRSNVLGNSLFHKNLHNEFMTTFPFLLNIKMLNNLYDYIY